MDRVHAEGLKTRLQEGLNALQVPIRAEHTSGLPVAVGLAMFPEDGSISRHWLESLTGKRERTSCTPPSLVELILRFRQTCDRAENPRGIDSSEEIHEATVLTSLFETSSHRFIAALVFRKPKSTRATTLSEKCPVACIDRERPTRNSLALRSGL